MAKTYDSKCHDLAEHFAQDEHLSKEELHELACEIQETVESFFSARENAAERAYDRTMEEPTFRGGEYAASVAADRLFPGARRGVRIRLGDVRGLQPVKANKMADPRNILTKGTFS